MPQIGAQALGLLQGERLLGLKTAHHDVYQHRADDQNDRQFDEGPASASGGRKKTGRLFGPPASRYAVLLPQAE
jgi:hypothetical protein